MTRSATGLRSELRPTARTAGGDALLTALKREWNLNRPNEHGVPLQDEFGGDEEAFQAYKRHETAGDIAICGGARRRTTEPGALFAGASEVIGKLLALLGLNGSATVREVIFAIKSDNLPQVIEIMGFSPQDSLAEVRQAVVARLPVGGAGGGASGGAGGAVGVGPGAGGAALNRLCSAGRLLQFLGCSADGTVADAMSKTTTYNRHRVAAILGLGGGLLADVREAVRQCLTVCGRLPPGDEVSAFGGDRQAAEAYARHERAGDITVLESKHQA